jgi:molybdopterin-guanine dinucleotide biosynthesis protein A
MSISQFAGLVLAGGQSSRMGTDKSKLVFQKKTLLDHACFCLRNTGISTVAVSGTHAGYVCIPDAWPFAGPAAAILSAVMHFNIRMVDYVMVVPVDMPLLSSSLLIMLMQTMKSEFIESTFIQNNPFPCCIKVSALKELALDYLQQPGISMQKLLTEKLNYKELDFNEEMAKNFININTPEAFSKLRADHET